MSLLPFKRQFEPFIVSGEKTHTIRAERKIPFKVGETLHCYVDPRHKSMRLIGRFPCTRVQQIFIDERALSPEATFVDIRIDGLPLSLDEKIALAIRDGFRSPDERCPGLALVKMMEFWKGRLPFYGQIIHWRFEAEEAARV